MASSFPTGLDSFATNTVGTDSLVGHAQRHDDIADALNKIETDLGVNTTGIPGRIKKAGDTMSGVLGFNRALATSTPVLDDRNGDDLVWAVSAGQADPLRQGISAGTAGSPVGLVGPLVKLAKTEDARVANFAANNTSEQNAVISAMVKNVATSECQAVAVFGYAESKSTQSAQNDDACAMFGTGVVSGSGTGYAIGAYIQGRRETTSGNVNGLEVRCTNNTNTDGTYNAAGASNTMGIWLTPGAPGFAGRISGVAISTGVINSCQWDVGLGFTTMGGVSSVKTTTIRDDTSSTNSILINGTHTVGIGVAAGAGVVAVGRQSGLGFSEIFNVYNNGNKDPIAVISGQGASDLITTQLRNGSGSVKWFVVGGAGGIMSGTQTGDTGWSIGTAGKRAHIGGSAQTPVLSVEHTGTGRFGAYGVLPVVQPSGTGETVGVVNGSGNTVFVDSTFTGNLGTTAYRINDVVKALKQLGWLAL